MKYKFIRAKLNNEISVGTRLNFQTKKIEQTNVKLLLLESARNVSDSDYCRQ